MNGASVADILKDQLDFTGANIETVYSKVSKIYAVYRTPERVMVQYADDEKLGSEQRLALAPLNPTRGEINGLIDGWRGNSYVNARKKQAKAKLFDRRTADALTVALQGDQAHAAALLDAVKADILEERTSIGRTEYLIVATISALCMFLLFSLISSSADPLPAGSFRGFVATNNIWLATGVGCLGALFSIALGIRGREIRTDLQRRDNVVDAVLRIMIGAVSAVFLFSLFKSELVTLKIGQAAIDLAKPHAMIVIAFLAGFSERLVGNFLSTAVLAGIGATPAEATTKSSNVPKTDADEQNPRGKEPVSAATGDTRSADNDDDVHVHDDDDTDGCVCDEEIGVNEMTDDVELPEASGGVEKATA